MQPRRTSAGFDEAGDPPLWYRAVRYPFKHLQATLWRCLLLLPLSLYRSVLETYAARYTGIDPRYRTCSLTYDERCWFVERASGERYYLPNLRHNAGNVKSGTLARICKGGFGSDPMTKRYLLDGFVDVEEGDTVVDVGAYVGTFAALAAPDANAVYCFEPDESNFHSLQRNVDRFGNVTTLDRGVWSETGDVSFRTSSDSSDSAVRSDGSDATVPVVSLADFAAELGVEAVDFLKVDVEGFEHHVVEGIGDLDVEKVSVDCSEGDDNVRTVVAWLASHGYDVETRDHLVYARSSDSDGPCDEPDAAKDGSGAPREQSDAQEEERSDAPTLALRS